MAASIDQRGLVAAVPQGAGALVGAIDVRHIAAGQGNDEVRYALGILRREEQVYMVGHQHIGVQGASSGHTCRVRKIRLKYPLSKTFMEV